MNIRQLFWMGLLLGCTTWAGLAVEPGALPGQLASGEVLLPNQWRLSPAGTQVALGDFPVNIAVHPKGRYAAILHSGHGSNEIIVVDYLLRQVTDRARIPESFYGLSFDRDGNKVIASGAGSEVLHRFTVSNGKFGVHDTVALRTNILRGIPGGIALTRDGKRAYVANVWGQLLSVVSLGKTESVLDVPMGTSTNLPILKITPQINTNAAVEESAEETADVAAITKRAESEYDPTSPDAPFPYACVLDESEHRLYVSLWAQACVAVVDTRSNKIIARWATEEHPNEMTLSKSRRWLYVANANRNTVSVLDTRTGRAVETLSTSLYPGLPAGSTPNSLALSPDDKTLYVANACNNNIAVFDVAKPGKSRSLGFIPAGWYPTSVRVSPDGKYLLVANGKGQTSLPNPRGPQPGIKAPKGAPYLQIGSLFTGTLSIIEIPKSKGLDAAMAEWTATTYRCSPLHTNITDLAFRAADNPIPLRPGEVSPIKYCIYIVKENRTYDQVLGDMKEGNGDPKLCIFPELVTPNHHKLAREFVLLDNFYVESEVSADGHEWSMAAYATDFVEKMWPLNYNHNKHKKYPYPAEGHFPIAEPATGYLWDKAKEAGITYRSYGEFVVNPKTDSQPTFTRQKNLQDHFDPWFRGFDVNYSDLQRADRFISELKRFESEGDMPRLQIVRLPNDHTSGATTNKLTPTAYLAQNDLALGQLIEAVSRSKFWSHTAIFIVEDDAQNGPDHVDAHRTIAYAISPYIKRRSVDSTMYSTSSMLRTMELILGLSPMTQFDLAAMPMFKSFQGQPDLTPYTAAPANVSMDEVNVKTAWGAEESRKMDFTKEDAADDIQLNEIIWRSVKGADSPMPAPLRAAFVFAHPDKDGGDD